ncbi:MAG: hypothetical protein ABH844_05450 [Candidatus Omnitrophota bacterium]
MVADTREAFDRFLSDDGPCAVKHKRLDYKKAISVIVKSGGVPVLAHPGTMGKDEYISDYIKAGLKGIEVFHYKHRIAANRRYGRICGRYGLIATGGSDCHGGDEQDILMGRVPLKYDIVEKLREQKP